MFKITPKIRILILIGLSLCGINSVIAQTSNTETLTKSDSTFNDILNLSIEDLMNMKVTVSSKTSEKISDAPGSITAYSDKDITKLGYYTLGDLANITSGYSAFKGIGETTFETRGQKQDGFDNNQHLVLIDGIPFNHARANMALAEENLPLFFAKRVEFLKGPGSALYGTSAFSGVINIISKDLETMGSKVESKFSMGNNDFNRRAMMNIITKSKMGLSKLSISYYGKDHSNAFIGTAGQQNMLSKYYDGSTSIFVNASQKITEGKLKGFGAGLIYSRKVGGIGEFWMASQTQTFPNNELTWEQVVPYLKYDRKLTDRLSFDSYLKGNMSTERAYSGGWFNLIQNNSGGGTGFNLYNCRVYDKELLAELKYSVSEHSDIIAGVNVISRAGSGAPQTYGYSINSGPGTSLTQDPSWYRSTPNYSIYSAFLQGQHKVDVLKGLLITGGVRLDMVQVTSADNNSPINNVNQLSPRAAGVLKVTDEINIKYMFGMALRAPSVKEEGINKEIRVKTENSTTMSASDKQAIYDKMPNLKSENIFSNELAITYNTLKFSANLTGFINRTNDPLKKVWIGNDQGYVNANGYVKASGYEFEIGSSPITGLKVSANASYGYAQLFTTSKDGVNKTDTTIISYMSNVPTTKVNGYITYSLTVPVKISTTLVGHFVENYRVGGLVTSRMAGFKVFDLNIIGEISENLSLEMQVRNLFNEAYRTPGFIATGTLSLPNPGRSVMGTLVLKF